MNFLIIGFDRRDDIKAPTVFDTQGAEKAFNRTLLKAFSYINRNTPPPGTGRIFSILLNTVYSEKHKECNKFGKSYADHYQNAFQPRLFHLERRDKSDTRRKKKQKIYKRYINTLAKDAEDITGKHKRRKYKGGRCDRQSDIFFSARCFRLLPCLLGHVEIGKSYSAARI